MILVRIPSVLSSSQALVLADHGNTFRDIRLSTAGIIFLGTPHQGSEAAVYSVCSDGDSGAVSWCTDS